MSEVKCCHCKSEGELSGPIVFFKCGSQQYADGHVHRSDKCVIGVLESTIARLRKALDACGHILGRYINLHEHGFVITDTSSTLLQEARTALEETK